MMNGVNLALDLLIFSLNCAHCTERNIRKESYKHGDCKTNHFENFTVCISEH